MPFSVLSWDMSRPRDKRVDVVDVDTLDAANEWALDNVGFGRAYVVRPHVAEPVREVVFEPEADLPLLDAAPEEPAAPVRKRSKRSNTDD
jgi:hypothetical protein